MTFLEIVKFLRQECEIPGTGPTTIVSQAGQLKRLVDWCIAAYEDIQNEHDDWRWLRKAFTFDTADSDGIYVYGDLTDVEDSAAISRFSHWWMHDEEDPWLCYLTSGGVGGEYHLTYLPWDQFRWLYRRGTQNDSQPIHISVDHADQICLGPVPNGIYTVTGDYQRSPEVLAADATVPEFPPEFHKLIPYTAMVKYASNSVAPELIARAQFEEGKLMSRLERRQRPVIEVGDPLIY